MSVENLDKIFQPSSIAVVGASERKGSVGDALMRNLIERGFAGEIRPINPNHKNLKNILKRVRGSKYLSARHGLKMRPC